ncbi:MAG: hypothetical protein HZC55_27270 [Verrucomicrobia bacterium]|jgi:hypothetical protein|nr:hypothetical protein [Verrucomicrobiota bacterium]
MASAKSPSPPPVQSLDAERSVRGASYLNRTAQTPDPWKLCAALEYGGDRSFATAVEQLVVQTAPKDWPKLEQQLLSALALPECTAAGRAFLCRMLALVGSAKGVPALAALVRDPRTADAARTALEVIPGPEASAALRDALAALSGPAKAGAIGSIVARRDTAARPALTRLREQSAEPAIVRGTAARALQYLPTT